MMEKTYLRMKRRIVAFACAFSVGLALSACGSSTADPVKITDVTEENETVEEIVETDKGDDSVIVEETALEESTEEPQEPKSDEDVVTDVSHQKIDPDILERDAIRVYNSPENQRFDESGRLASVVAHDYDGNEYDMFSYEYDSNGRVSKVTEHSSTDNVVLSTTYERDSRGNKVAVRNEMPSISGSGGVTQIEYDDNGKRICDRNYTSDGSQLDTYRVFLYDEQGLRIGTECRNTISDEVISNEVYEYDSNGQLINAYEYYNGNLSIHKEFVWDGDQFSSVTLYDGDGNSLGTSYSDSGKALIPIYVFEVIDY